MTKTHITVEFKETVEGCNGHEHHYDELMDKEGHLMPLKKEGLYFITIWGIQVRLCPDCKNILIGKLALKTQNE